MTKRRFELIGRFAMEKPMSFFGSLDENGFTMTNTERKRYVSLLSQPCSSSSLSDDEVNTREGEENTEGDGEENTEGEGESYTDEANLEIDSSILDLESVDLENAKMLLLDMARKCFIKYKIIVEESSVDVRVLIEGSRLIGIVTCPECLTTLRPSFEVKNKEIEKWYNNSVTRHCQSKTHSN